MDNNLNGQLLPLRTGNQEQLYSNRLITHADDPHMYFLALSYSQYRILHLSYHLSPLVSRNLLFQHVFCHSLLLFDIQRF